MDIYPMFMNRKTQICHKVSSSIGSVELKSESQQVICGLLFSGSVLSLLRPHGLQPPWLLCPRDFPGKNTGVGSHPLLQEIFPTQGSGLLH